MPAFSPVSPDIGCNLPQTAADGKVNVAVASDWVYTSLWKCFRRNKPWRTAAGRRLSPTLLFGQDANKAKAAVVLMP